MPTITRGGTERGPSVDATRTGPQPDEALPTQDRSPVQICSNAVSPEERGHDQAVITIELPGS
jgi:hypothetical protein